MLRATVHDALRHILNVLEEGDYDLVKSKLQMLADIDIKTDNERVLDRICEYDTADEDFCRSCGKQLDDEEPSKTCSLKCENLRLETKLRKKLQQKIITPEMKIGQWYYCTGYSNQPNQKIEFWRDGHEVGATIFKLGQKKSDKPGRMYEESLDEIDRVPGHYILVETMSPSEKRKAEQEGRETTVKLESLPLDEQDLLLLKLRPRGNWSIRYHTTYVQGVEYVSRIYFYEMTHLP